MFSTSKRFAISALFLAFSCAAAWAQAPSIGGVTNAASFLNQKLPNGGIARGGMFTVFGSNIGPAQFVQASAFPLPTQLAGSSVQVNIGGQTIDCWVVVTLASQVTAILPSSAPAGTGTLSVEYNGVRTSTIPITIVENAFGAFAINTAGNGPGVFTDPAFRVNTIVNSAAQSSQWDIWGTGLGPTGDESNGPLPGDLPVNVQVFVGGQPAEVVYRGRSGCCSGIDQIRFAVPSNVAGCYVPVHVVVEGVPSNITTMSIAPEGGVCSEPALGLTEEILSRVAQGNDFSYGAMMLSRNRLSIEIPGLPTGFETTSDSIGGDYSRFTPSEAIRRSAALELLSVGSCNVIQFSGDVEEVGFDDPVEGTPLDAGEQLTVTGPSGERAVPKVDPGSYFLSVTQGLPGFIKGARAAAAGSVNQTNGSGLLEPGAYTMSAPGGADVGAHSGQIDVPAPLNWINRAQISQIQRSQGLTVNYSTASPFIQVFGFAAHTIDEETDEVEGAIFFCLADSAAGSFTVPPAVLNMLPESPRIENIPTGMIGVGATDSNIFEAQGLDIGVISHIDLDIKTVDYR